MPEKEVVSWERALPGSRWVWVSLLGGKIVLFCGSSANTVCWVSAAPEKPW